MATCSYCQQRKGKRTCPALGGTLCSQCCGQHRLVDIACPSECSYLGGLSVVRDGASSTTFTKADYEAACTRLHAFAGSNPDARNPALVLVLDDSQVQEWEMGVATAFLSYGYRDAKRQRLIDRLLTARGRGLPAGQVAALVALQRAWASLFEVVSVQTGIGLELRDLLSGDTIQVRDVSASGHLKKWDVLFGWVMTFNDHLELTGAACLVPRPHLERVRAALDAALVTARREHPDLPARDLTSIVAWAPIRALRDAFNDFQLPDVRTSDGHGIVFCKAHYEVKDEAQVRDRLTAHHAFERADDASFSWLGREPDAALLGCIVIADGELVLETMARERNARGKLLLEDLLGDLIVHRLDSLQAPDSAIRATRDRPRTKPAELPDDVQRDVVGNYLQDHYRSWPDDPLPALAGKTPRKAVRTRKGRAQVDALLKDIENGTIKMPGGDAVDFAALRRELGLDTPSHPSASYDSELAPDPATWLATDDAEKSRAIEEHHRSLAPHPDMPNPRAHALMHLVVENQLAANDPPTVAATLQRLLDGGLTRHEALHAIASVVASAIFDVTKHAKPVDQTVIASSLARLRPEPWRFMPRR